MNLDSPSPRYLLDTNIPSDLVRYPQGGIATRIASVGETAICTSIIVAAELRFGAAKRNAPKLTRQVETLLNAIDILPLDLPTDHIYAQIRLTLERNGQPTLTADDTSERSGSRNNKGLPQQALVWCTTTI